MNTLPGHGLDASLGTLLRGEVAALSGWTAIPAIPGFRLGTGCGMVLGDTWCERFLIQRRFGF